MEKDKNKNHESQKINNRKTNYEFKIVVVFNNKLNL